MHPDMPLRRAVSTAIGGGLGIGLMIGLAMLAGIPLMAVPFTTSIVLVMGAPDSRQAQPRNVVGGHLVSALCGLGVVLLCGPDPWFAALAVALSIFVMHVSGTLHPPAGINALLMVTGSHPWTFVLMPVGVGALVLVGFAFIYHRLTWPGAWPRSWWS